METYEEEFTREVETKIQGFNIDNKEGDKNLTMGQFRELFINRMTLHTLRESVDKFGKDTHHEQLL